MNPLTLRFHGPLNDFLAPERRGVEFAHPLPAPCSVKDLIESLGPPHPEVDVVLVDGEAVDFSHRVQHGQRIAVHPPGCPPDGMPSLRVGPPALSEPRFLLDVGLGRLASLLRMLGFDTVWRNDFADDVLARRSRDEQRILLTRDLGVLKRSEVVHGYFPRETNPSRQLPEVARRYGLVPRMRPFTRCLACNTPLVGTSPDEVRGRVPERVLATFSSFQHCPGCQRVFWAGSHHDRMRALIDSLRGV
ncbi:hypothetical protein CYFUS_000665 [Cystobacter fuscus]|uniref:Twitching motility protein PilT n=1 Tax=Cystobacter fuscus TaxID=43 RepID=A0A250IVG7_9BACT|nr:Mut7-C RNAse domain-containing protein [Cystobacter fuscus]ATB35253.1 hypothetical protein CYFUS_000665 [Cystobacter fuscus]